MDSVGQHRKWRKWDALQIKSNYMDSVILTVLEQIVKHMQNIHGQEIIPDRKTRKKNECTQQILHR